MTREEAAIRSCEDRIKHLENAPKHHLGKGQRKRAIELEKVKISALRPISREQVEKVWRGEWKISDYGYFCSRCGTGLEDYYIRRFKFCPFCGRPMTDEAVEMVMGKLEELYGNR